MVDQAIEKVKTEMEEKKNPYVKLIGEYLLDFIHENVEIAEKIAAEDKSIMGSLSEMRKEAEKNKVGNMAMLTPEDGFAVVLKYYEIDSVEPKKPNEAKKEDSFDVSLDDYL